ncbi:Rha family transcriptional regulator [Clostridium sp. MD294]|uniref:Rha family transcriptional regulator n=1 Tax=Clostridium sp. MD294 TaxID=97138 RepID=UPI0002CA85D2|nr:Rha family transcriptional regulator [Clostridium sp. MD294]NDO46003.1 Rha family transcriptional regulator [Clostridium sp. MD294]USF30334.1 hypothetical protein C820_001775 [Clostridium sp. MD294]
MNKLILLKNNDVFTTSLVIAEGTGNEHHAIQQLLNKYKEDFEDFGKLLFTHLKCENKSETRGRKQKIYLLNEQQATLLMTYLKNTEIIRNFKKELVR